MAGIYYWDDWGFIMACGLSVLELLKHCLRISNEIPMEERTSHIILIRRYIQQAFDIEQRKHFTKEDNNGEENV